VEREIIEDNAALLIESKSIPTVPPRERVLELQELAAIWHATEEEDPTVRALVRLLMLVPARRNEAASMRWRDLKVDRREWHQPDTKNGKPHTFPLVDTAIVLLQEQQERLADAYGSAAREPGDLVFPGPRSGKVFKGWAQPLYRLRLRTGVCDWAFHDFRRSFALSRELDTARIDAKLKDGVLTVTIPKAETAKPHRIEVRSG